MFVNYERKKFYNIGVKVIERFSTGRDQRYKTFSSSLALRTNKLECSLMFRKKFAFIDRVVAGVVTSMSSVATHLS
jgi:hypothetical protein